MSKICVNCGAEMLDDAKFCPACGTEVKPAEFEEQVSVNEEAQGDNTTAEPDLTSTVSLKVPNVKAIAEKIGMEKIKKFGIIGGVKGRERRGRDGVIEDELGLGRSIADKVAAHLIIPINPLRKERCIALILTPLFDSLDGREERGRKEKQQRVIDLFHIVQIFVSIPYQYKSNHLY